MLSLGKAPFITSTVLYGKYLWYAQFLPFSLPTYANRSLMYFILTSECYLCAYVTGDFISQIAITTHNTNCPGM